MTTCPKCHQTSGNSWSQCDGVCPMPMSPHYRKPTASGSTITLKKALAHSDREFINGYEVDSYLYPTDFDATVVLEDVDDNRFEFYLGREITILDNGDALVRDIHGDEHSIQFFVTRPLREGDLQ